MAARTVPGKVAKGKCNTAVGCMLALHAFKVSVHAEPALVCQAMQRLMSIMVSETTPIDNHAVVIRSSVALS